jgi:hypothetical protein
MYYPYFRGKQYELITIRETAGLLADNGFVPIIEPAKSQLSGLKKTLDELSENFADGIVVVNPAIGDLRGDSGTILDFLNSDPFESNIKAGILLTEETSVETVVSIANAIDDREVVLVHAGFADARELADRLDELPDVRTSVFFDDYCGRLYRRHFRSHSRRVLLRDGFQSRRNRDHPETEFFSDLHITFEEEGMDGFGDFLIVGDDYAESGGPAYTIAIHLTYIDSDRDDEMHIRHFLSDRQDTPQDPAGKFAEALDKLIEHLDSDDNQFVESSAIQEFRELDQRGHYPGLGYVKKLSMKHHIETLGAFFEADDG